MKSLNNYISEKLVINKDFKKLEDFVYNHEGSGFIKIFDGEDWPQFRNYRDKVYINGENVELQNDGWTLKTYKPGLYNVYIENLEQLKNAYLMFWRCEELEKVPLFDTTNLRIMDYMFQMCTGLEEVALFDTSKVTTMNGTFQHTGLKNVPLFDTRSVEENHMGMMFANCYKLSKETKQRWSKIYDFERNNKI